MEREQIVSEHICKALWSALIRRRICWIDSYCAYDYIHASRTTPTASRATIHVTTRKIDR